MITNKLICYDMVENFENIILQSSDNKALYQINKEDGHSEILGYIEGEKNNIRSATGRVVFDEECFFFSPLMARSIVIYNFIEKKIVQLPLKSYQLNDEIYGDGYAFWTSLVINNYIYIFGFHYPAVLRINKKTFDIVYMTEWKRKIPTREMYLATNNNCYFGCGYIEYQNYFIIPCGVSAGIWKMNRREGKIDYWSIDCDIHGFFSIGEFQEKIILTPIDIQDKRAVIWRPEFNDIKIIYLSCGGLWHSPIVYQNFIYFFPYSAKSHIIKYDTDTDKCEIYNRLDNLLDQSFEEGDRVLAVKQRGNVCTFIRISDHCWINYDFEKDIIEEKYYMIEDEQFLRACRDEDYNVIFSKAQCEGKVMMEDEIPLDDFVDRL